ncbi:MAG: hypothetical protein AB1578_22990 [Thermodesulfobacteriota bacterium]
MDYSYIGAGKVYIKDNSTPAGLLEVGNVSKLEFSVEEDAIELRDYTSPGGGVLNEVRRVKGVTATMTLHELKAENVALMLYGSTTGVNAGTVADEVVTGYPGRLTRLAHAGPVDVVVKNDFEGAAGGTTFVAGTDYEVRPGGIFVLAGGDITPGQTLHVAYGYGVEDVIEALTAAAKEYGLFFEGLNEAQSGRPFLVDVHRIRFGATKAFSLIGDAFAGFEVAGKVLKDTTKTGAGVSQFFKATSQQVAAVPAG